MSPLSDRTRLIASATQRGRGRRPVNPPIERASTMLNDATASMRDETIGPVYGLGGTGTARALRDALADLEHAADVFLVPSGLAAITVPILAMTRPGDEVITTDALYGPSRRFLTRYMAARGVTTRFHAAGATAHEVAAMITDQTKLVLLESPASLTFEMLDVPALATAARARGVLTVMDNTWGAGLAFRPLAHGVDVSAQAVTKYVSGHSDVLMGSIAVDTIAIRQTIADAIEDTGWHVSPDDASLALRGLRTMTLRMAEQAKSALVVARWLQCRPEVSRVLYPPLPGSVGHDLWTRDFTGASALMGVIMKGGSRAEAEAFLDALSLFGLGYSWGGFESLITHETGQMDWRNQKPVLEGELVRLHIGLEDPVDLIADLNVGLAAWRTQQDSNLQHPA